MLNLELSGNAAEYIKNTDTEYRKKLGQFFTPKILVNYLIKALSTRLGNNNTGLSILEPSCGTGEFLSAVCSCINSPDITAIEIDSRLSSITKKRFNDVNVLTQDFLDFNPDKQFDVILGNPPYFETKDVDRHRYKDVICGRVNIYSLFVKHSIDLVKPGGFVAFVLPVSMNTGKYFSKLREYILNTCSISYIRTFKSDLFDGAQQEVQILILKKKKVNRKSSKYVLSHNGITVFTKDYLKYRKLYKQSISIEDLGFTVFTGETVWNNHKPFLYDNQVEGSVPLLWSENINDVGTISLNREKNQYIIPTKGVVRSSRCLVVNRIVGSNNKSMRVAIVDLPKFSVENHINIIEPTDKAKVSVDILKDRLVSGNGINLLCSLTGNTQISKMELLKLLPIWV